MQRPRLPNIALPAERQFRGPRKNPLVLMGTCARALCSCSCRIANVRFYRSPRFASSADGAKHGFCFGRARELAFPRGAQLLMLRAEWAIRGRQPGPAAVPGKTGQAAWRRAGRWAVLLAASLLAAACSLAGDVTPPPGSGFATQPPAQATLASTPGATTPHIVEPLLPEARPVALDGGAVYQEHCAACHGPRGSGGGSMTAQLPAPPPDFADPATLRDSTPQDLFRVVTQGRLDKFMPPFGDSLSVAERWNAVAYLYTLSAPAEQVAAGEAVYAASCAGCHGERGQGDGAEAAALDTPPPDLSDHKFAVIRSPQAHYDSLLGADTHHAAAARLSEADRWAAVNFARTLAYDYSPPEAVLAEGQGTVRGQVVNQTAGAATPGGLPVTLHGFEAETLMTTLTTTTAADGGFAFDAVDFAPGRQFVVTTEYQGVTYSSDPASFTPGAETATLELPLPVYETTSDDSQLTIAQAHMFLEFVEPESVTVGELYVFSNRGDKTLVAEGDQPLQFSLPEGATDLNVQGGRLDETFFRNDRGFAVLWSIPPGEATSQMLYSYRLPYDGALNFAQPVDYALDNVNVLVSDLGVTVSGPQLQSLGVQDFQGEQFQNFSQGALAPGDTFAFEVSGQPGSSATGGGAMPGGAASALTDTSGLAVGLGALALALLGIGFWLYRRQPRALGGTREELLQALAELDDDYAAGEVAEAEYRRERQQLKDELKRQWE